MPRVARWGRPGGPDASLLGTFVPNEWRAFVAVGRPNRAPRRADRLRIVTWDRGVDACPRTVNGPLIPSTVRELRKQPAWADCQRVNAFRAIRAPSDAADAPADQSRSA
jgi:hypothetical protein